MDLQQLVQNSVGDTKASLWPWFAPETLLSITIMVMLLLRLPRWLRALDISLVAVVGAALALVVAVRQLPAQPGELFTGMLVMDGFTVFARAIVLAFLILFVILTRLTAIVHADDAADFYCLVFGAVLGMCLMISANHLLMVFLAVEMASVPSYALAATVKGQRRASEAGLKYVVYGAGASGIMLYGISLLAGLTGAVHLPSIAAVLAEQLPAMEGPQRMVLALSGIMILAGLAFKLSAFPYHFWCPDVFEGASAEIGAFLSVASKAAALVLLVRVTLGVGLPTDRTIVPPMAIVPADVAHADTPESNEMLVRMAETPASEPRATTTDSPASDGAASIRWFLALVLAFMAAITCTFGNLAAYGQTNIKRLLAYSTIAHAGYMMLAVPAALVMATNHPDGAARAVASLGIYLGVYLFMNLVAFSIVAFLRNALGSEEIADYAGLIHHSPTLVVCMALAMFSLVGIPPLAGFIGKFAIFASLAEGYQLTGDSFLIALLVVGGLNTAVSLFYYLRVIKVMSIDPEPDRARWRDWSMVSLSGAYLVAVTVPLILLFVRWETLNDWAFQAAAQLF